MKTERSILLLFLGFLLAISAVALFSTPGMVQAQCDPAVDPNCQPPPPGCFDNQGLPCTQTPQPPSNNNPQATKVPTRTPTPVFTDTPTPTSTSTAMNSAAPTATTFNPTATATATATPAPFCILCGKLSPWLLGGGGVILLIGLAGILLLVFRRPLGLGTSGAPGGTDPFPGGSENGTVMPPGVGTDNYTIVVNEGTDLGGESELLPAIQKGVIENATMTTPDGSDLGGGMESATLTVRDGSDISPDGVSNVREAANNPGVKSSAREAARNPGGVNYPPDPGKSGGGTL